MASDPKNLQPITKPSPVAGRSPGPAHFYRFRQRISTGLLLFVVVVGLPIVGIPTLRQRLSSRVEALKIAMAGGIAPVMVKVGENQEPFPPEYEKPEPPLPFLSELASREKVFTFPPAVPAQQAPQLQARPRGVILEAPPPSEGSEQFAEQSTPESDNELQYGQGEIEREAYELLLGSNSIIAGMVQGGDASLRFVSWGATRRQDDTYWVRLTFQSSETNTDVEYIWQVKLLSKQITPLSYNARAIFQP